MILFGTIVTPLVEQQTLTRTGTSFEQRQLTTHLLDSAKLEVEDTVSKLVWILIQIVVEQEASDKLAVQKVTRLVDGSHARKRIVHGILAKTKWSFCK